VGWQVVYVLINTTDANIHFSRQRNVECNEARAKMQGSKHHGI
jgi:hypothetical protein